MGEVINSIKIIKFNNWVENFENRLLDVRNKIQENDRAKFAAETVNHLMHCILNNLLSFILFYTAYW